jgi:heat shock protein HslJ
VRPEPLWPGRRASTAAPRRAGPSQLPRAGERPTDRSDIQQIARRLEVTLVAIVYAAVLLQAQLPGSVRTAPGAQQEGTLDGAWHVEVIDHIQVLPEADVTVFFNDNRISGIASCNSYSGDYRAGRGQLRTEAIMTTLKACDEARMRQEREFLSLLRRITGYEIGTDGVLVLSTADGKQMTARRRPSA